jgi:hypothetical protein
MGYHGYFDLFIEVDAYFFFLEEVGFITEDGPGP